MSEIFELQGSVALVTGASRGIGRATARLLSEAGATVYACARDEEALRELASENEGVQVCVLDLRDEIMVEELASEIMEAHGRLDVLVNNAGVLGPRAT